MIHNRETKIGGAIRSLRNSLGRLSQERFARKLGTTTRTISRWEAAETLSPRILSRLHAIAIATGAQEVADFFAGKLRGTLDWEPPTPDDMPRTITAVIDDCIREIGAPRSIDAHWDIPVDRPGWACSITIGITFVTESKSHRGPAMVTVMAHGHRTGKGEPRGRATYVALIGNAAPRRITRKWIDHALHAEIEVARAAALSFTDDDLRDDLLIPSDDVYSEMDERFEASIEQYAELQ